MTPAHATPFSLGSAIAAATVILWLLTGAPVWPQERGISLDPEPRAGGDAPHPLVSKQTEGGEGLACNLIDFEGIPESFSIGRVEGDIDVTFGPSWLSVVDADAGGSGNIANEPSPSTAAFFLQGLDPITFSRGVQFIELFYTARADSIPITLTAWSGPGGTGQVIDQAVGNTVGNSFQGAPCQGDPTGEFCLWSAITLISQTDDIRSITLSGAVANAFAFDDMTFCTAPPLEVEVGEERRVRPPEVRPQQPTVVYGRNGTKAVIWQEQTAGGTVICIQLFDANDQPITPPQVINTTSGINTSPSGSFDHTLFVTWRNETGSLLTLPDGSQVVGKSNGSSLFGRFINTDGSAATGEVQVSSSDSEGSNDPSAATDLNGQTILTWEDDGEIKGQILDPNGNPVGGPIAVSDTSGGTSGMLQTVTASSPSGDFVTVWRQTTGDKTGILARLFDDLGAPKGDSFVVDGALNARAPDVAVDHDGNIIVVYEKSGSSGRDVFARLYTAAGAPQGAAYQANALAEGDQTRPKVDVNASGDFVIVWESSIVQTRFKQSTGPSLFGRFFELGGEAPRTEVVVAETEQGSPPTKPDVTINDDDEVTVVYEREGPDGFSEGIFQRVVEFTETPEPCVPDGETLCLNDSRFRVTASWEDPRSRDSGQTRRETLTSDTGYFYFFNADNVELVVKVLDACSFNDRYWVFAAGLTDVEINLRVEDTVAGVSNTYFNSSTAAQPQPFQPIQDTDAFATCEAGSSATDPGAGDAARERTLEPLAAVLAAELQALATSSPASPSGPGGSGYVARQNCVPTSTDLCLESSRFLVLAEWETTSGTGDGTAIGLTNNTGYYWFFNPANIELVVKVLDACSFSNRYWVFAAGLTNVGVRLTVIDTEGGGTKVYENPLGTPFAPIQDTDAFATCP